MEHPPPHIITIMACVKAWLKTETEEVWWCSAAEILEPVSTMRRTGIGGELLRTTGECDAGLPMSKDECVGPR